MRIPLCIESHLSGCRECAQWANGFVSGSALLAVLSLPVLSGLLAHRHCEELDCYVTHSSPEVGFRKDLLAVGLQQLHNQGTWHLHFEFH